MSKKSNIEELFKDSMDDFRVDPPKETSKKILLGLFWSTIIYHYKGAIMVSVAAVLAGIGALLYFNQTTENTTSVSVENNRVETPASKKDHSLADAKQNTYTANKERVYQNGLNSAESNNSSSSTKSKELVVPENKKQSISKEMLSAAVASSVKEKSFWKSTKNIIKTLPFTDNQSKGTATSAHQKEELIGPYGFMGEEGSEERNEYNKILKSGGFPNLAGPSEEPNRVVAAKTDSAFVALSSNNNNNDEIGHQEVLPTDTKVDSIAKNDLLAKSIADTLNRSDSVAEKKKKHLSYFAGVGVSQVIWNQSYNHNEINPANQATLLGGFIYKNYRFSSGLGYENHSIKQSSDFWTVQDSTSTLQSTVVYDSIAKDFDTTVVEVINPYSLNYTREGSTYQMSYLNLPIQLCYAYRFKRSEISLKVSTTLHFLVGTNVKEPIQETTGNVDLLMAPPKNILEPARFLMDYSLHVNYGYHFNDKWLLSAGIFTRQNLMNPLKDSSIPKNSDPQPRGYGAELQLFYKF